MSDNKLPSGRLYPKPRLGAIPGLRTINRTTPKNPTMQSVLGPQLSSNDFFTRKLGRIPSNNSHDEGPSSQATNKGKDRGLSDDMPEETTFRPRLTGRVLGSSLTNWRRTEPPPHLEEPKADNPVPTAPEPVQADFASLVAEMRFQRELKLARLQEDRAQREEDRARREANEHRAKRRRELDEDAKISTIINAAVNKLDTEDILKPDGSNLRRWEDALRLTAFERFHDQLFFTPSEDTVVDPYHEKIARGFIHSLVHADLSYDLVDFTSSAEVYKHLLSKFRIVNRAKQLHTWEALKKISLADYTSSAEAIAAVDRCARTFCEQGVDLTWDTIFSFVFQGNLRDHLGPVVNRKVDLFMETHEYESPTSGDILRFWESARTEHCLAAETGRSDPSALSVTLASEQKPSAAGLVSGSVSGIVSGSPAVEEISAMALTKPPSCYICKQNFPPCSVTYNFDRVPYIKPIQPETRTSSRPPVSGQLPAPPRRTTPSSGRPPSSTTQSRSVETQQINPNLFAEEEGDEAEYIFENEDLSAEPSGLRFNLREMTIEHGGQEALWDLGASDNVTGDRYALHDFTLLDQPIAVKVATDSACDYITGMGTLRFVGTNKAIIVVKKVYYCERARSTLLSLAAFKKANASFRVTGNFDSINLVSPSGRLLLSSVFDPRSNSGKYALTVRDVFTSYSEVRILKAKSEAAEMLMQTINQWETQLSSKVKILRSDNGGEFDSKAFGKYLTNKGIIAERSLLYHHFQNGAAERYNRTVADMGRSILCDSELGREFWGYAFMWAAWTLNRIPNRITKEKTPYEVFFGDKPQLDRTRVFGSRAFVLVAPEKRKKLDNRAVEGLVVGHLPESKGWTFWIPKTKALISSAWADFGRNTLPSTPEPPGKGVSPEAKPPPVPEPRAKQLILNDFKDEKLVEEQERLVDTCQETCADNSGDVPLNFKAAMRSTEAAEWKKAINVELENMKRKHVWIVRRLPTNRHKLGARWVFAKKMNEDGSVRYKARYVAKGYNQKEGTDFAHTFAPTATFTSMRILLSIAARNNWPIYNFDFVAAYLNAPIDEEVWVQAPEGLDVGADEACLLQRALYGTKQAARCWWKHLSGTLADLGYVSSYYDSSVYTLSSKKDKSIIWVHVDDGIVTGSSDEALKLIETQLKGSLEIKWNEGLTSMVGVKIKRTEDGFELTQPNLINKILRDHWDGTTVHSSPLPKGYSANTDPEDHGSNGSTFLSIIGGLSYVAVGTRPDIAYSVNYLARFSGRPTTIHWKGIRHLLGYVAETKSTPLRIHPSKDQVHPVECYVEANWGGPNSRSTYGVLIKLYGAPIMWVSRRLVTVASSTCQAEYMALGHATRHALWIRNLLFDIIGAHFPVKIYCNNQSAVKIGCEDASNKRTHHIEREFYITNQALYEKKTSLTWIPGTDQIADVLTKALGKSAHAKCGAIIQGFLS
ncbi:hypothetical protein PtB15_4B770 [Puccinia triticina]|nr:hypothetical protein PtB15_4B770 [Puccinia triticina]